MKKYKYVRMKAKTSDMGLFAKYVHQGADLETHRDVIDRYAARGYRFVGTVPVKSVARGFLVDYDLVFEIDE